MRCQFCISICFQGLCYTISPIAKCAGEWMEMLSLNRDPWVPGPNHFTLALADSSSLFLEVLRREEWERKAHFLSQTKKKEIFHSWFNLQSPLWGLWPTSCDVKIEEIAVKDRLHHARHHGDLVEEAFCVITPHPVCDVESAVQAEEEQVVCGDGLRLPGFGDHEELRHYGYGLQENGEGPQDLGGTTRKERVKLSRAGVTLANWPSSFY